MYTCKHYSICMYVYIYIEVDEVEWVDRLTAFVVRAVEEVDIYIYMQTLFSGRRWDIYLHLYIHLYIYVFTYIYISFANTLGLYANTLLCIYICC